MERFLVTDLRCPKGGNLWIRLLAAAWPNDNDLIILHPFVKKQNKIPKSDIAHAEANLKNTKDKTTERDETWHNITH